MRPSVKLKTFLAEADTHGPVLESQTSLVPMSRRCQRSPGYEHSDMSLDVLHITWAMLLKYNTSKLL